MKLNFKRSTWAGVILAGVLTAGLGAVAVAQPPATAETTTTTQTTTTADAPATKAGEAPLTKTGDQAAAAAAPADPAQPETKTPPKTAAETDRDGPPPKIAPGVYDRIFKILFSALVVAALLESALAVIFNWSIFLRYFDGRGVKTLVSVIMGWIIVYGLKIDLIGRVYDATNDLATDPHPLGNAGYFLSALIVGGGSAGIRNIMRAFGWRDVLTREDVTPKPKGDQAWLAVSLKRQKDTVGPVRVLLKKNEEPLVLIGMIAGKKSPPLFLRGFVTDSARFPPVAGHPVEGEQTYTVIVQGPNDKPDSTAVKWGPFKIKTGAIVDIELSV